MSVSVMPSANLVVSLVPQYQTVMTGQDFILTATVGNTGPNPATTENELKGFFILFVGENGVFYVLVLFNVILLVEIHNISYRGDGVHEVHLRPVSHY